MLKNRTRYQKGRVRNSRLQRPVVRKKGGDKGDLLVGRKGKAGKREEEGFSHDLVHRGTHSNYMSSHMDSKE